MSLRTELEASGNWFFRHRTYLPFATLPLFAICLGSFSYLGDSHTLNEFWQLACILVSFLGLGIRVITVGHTPIGTSGRNTSAQIADTLNTTGMYSVVRHPLYLGNYLIMIGFTLFLHVWWLVLLTSCIYALYYERIMLAEEDFLRKRFGDTFEQWASATPAFIPRRHGWKPASMPFCWRTALQREYNAFFLITTTFSVLDLIGDSLVAGRLHVDYVWVAVFIAGFVIFNVLRTLKKRTNFLNVAGR